MTWETTETLDTGGRYALCRCGQSAKKPFCDGTHSKAGFQADDSDTGPYHDRATELGGTGMTIEDDRSICVHAGFCGNRLTNVWKQVEDTADSTVRSQVIAMIERCPSGALTYRLDSGNDIEPLMPTAVSVTDGGPLWVTGRIPVELPDGRTLEVRNRVTLCRCGASANKPLCDGTHKDIEFERGEDDVDGKHHGTGTA